MILLETIYYSVYVKMKNKEQQEVREAAAFDTREINGKCASIQLHHDWFWPLLIPNKKNGHDEDTRTSY